MADTFSAILTGGQEISPNSSAANSTGTITWDAAADTIIYDLTITSLNFERAAAMHFLGGNECMAGPVVLGQLNPAQDTNDFMTIMNDDGSWTVHSVWDTIDLASTPITDFVYVLNTRLRLTRLRRFTGASTPRVLGWRDPRATRSYRLMRLSLTKSR